MGAKGGNALECFSSSNVFLKEEERRKWRELSSARCSPAPESPGCCFSVTLEVRNRTTVGHSLLGRAGNKNPQGINPQVKREIKTQPWAGSASFSVLFQTPRCTSKCHYGLCYAAGRECDFHTGKGKSSSC